MTPVRLSLALACIAPLLGACNDPRNDHMRSVPQAVHPSSHATPRAAAPVATAAQINSPATTPFCGGFAQAPCDTTGVNDGSRPIVD